MRVYYIIPLILILFLQVSIALGQDTNPVADVNEVYVRLQQK